MTVASSAPFIMDGMQWFEWKRSADWWSLPQAGLEKSQALAWSALAGSRNANAFYCSD